MTSVAAWRTPLTIGLLTVVSAFLTILSGNDSAFAVTNFSPCAISSLTNDSPNASSDIKGTFGIGIGADCIIRSADDDPEQVNFGAVIGFTPPEWAVPQGTTIPIGAVVGTLASNATLGLINAQCATSLQVNFTFVNASINTSDTIDTRPPGHPKNAQPLHDDVSPANGIPDGADHYPQMLNELFPGLTPWARLFGSTTIPAADNEPVILSFVIFKPGTKVSDLIDLDPALGYPSVTVLQDPTVPPAPSAITDFCSPLESKTTIFGVTQDNPNTAANEGGTPYRTNPGNGAYNFVSYSASQRDADNDGIENSMDPCPNTPDPDWDPRLSYLDPSYPKDSEGKSAGDKDRDGIPNSCDNFPDSAKDPTVPGSTFSDADADGFANRGDNCPQVRNGEDVDISIRNQLDEDDFPAGRAARGDGIGNACDTNPNSLDGDYAEVCRVTVINVGTGGTPAVDPQKLRPCDPTAALTTAAGTTAADADNDGVPDAQDNCPAVVNAAQVDSDGDGKGDACDDSDGDGVMDAVDRCPGTPAGAVIDQFGCTPAQAQEDADGDGVKNIDDECPNTAAGASVNAKGCSTAQLAAVSGPTGGGVGGPDTGVGALAPAVGSIPAWAAIASGLGGAGLLGSLSAFLARFTRRRRR